MTVRRRFAGQSSDFSNLNLNTGENTNPSGTSVYTFVLPTLTQEQVDLLMQSYTALKNLVYDAVVLQTRLKNDLLPAANDA